MSRLGGGRGESGCGVGEVRLTKLLCETQYRHGKDARDEELWDLAAPLRCLCSIYWYMPEKEER